MANNYALIQNGLVSSVILADAAVVQADFPGAVLIDGMNPTPGVGWSYANGTFTAPPPPTPPPPSNPVFTKIAYMNLFTQPELIACFNYPNNTNLTTDQKAELTVFFQYFNAADTVDMTQTPTQQGLQLLESCGLIGTGRAAQILASRN